MSTTVACLQLRIDSVEPVAERVERTLAWLAEVAPTADLVVLPELWHVGAFDIEAARAHAEPLDGPLVLALSKVARDSQTWIHGGSIAERDGDNYFNTSVVFAPDGSLAAAYRKIHLFGFDGGETTLMSAGEDVITVDLPTGKSGIATCYDLRFPELFRAFVDEGATAAVLASGWPTRRINHWSVLARARAIENQMLVVACNEVGTHGGTELGGRSIIVDARGEVLAEGGSEEELVIAQVDIDDTLLWREQFPNLADRVL